MEAHILFLSRMRSKKFYFSIFLASILFLISSCGEEKNTEINTKNTEESKQEKPRVSPPEFNADSAFLFIEKQADFGPRVPGTKAHENCLNWLEKKLRAFGFSVSIQSAPTLTYDNKQFNLKNIIASFNPEKAERILLCAHWDSRPICDRDSIPSNKSKACPGVNDGASGVGVLLEIARAIQLKSPESGIDIVFFDLEDYGQPENSGLPRIEDSWCLGAQYWARNPHTLNYTAKFGILLDMVGAKNATFMQEGGSLYFARGVTEYIWNTADKLGFANYFVKREQQGGLTDDHLYINRVAHIPTVDIIHYDEKRSDFFEHHHKLSDDIKNIDKATLKAVGQTVLEVVYNP